MFKFFRKYEKWMLVVFCSALMLAFLVPQAMDQFSPNSAKRTVATLYDGEIKITIEDRQRASYDLETLARLGLASRSLVPIADNDDDQALGWLLMVHAGEHAGLSASSNQAFQAIALAHNIRNQVRGIEERMEDEDDLAKLAQDLGTSSGHLLDVARQYLIAEQYRQLAQGVAFEVNPEGGDNTPGLRRLQQTAQLEGNPQFQQLIQQTNIYQQLGMEQEAMRGAIAINAAYASIEGRPRIAEPVLQHYYQQQQTKVSGTVAVFDSVDYENAIGEPDLAKLEEVFEAYRGNFPFQGEPHQFGYRVAHRVKLEAVRIPIEAVRELVASEITHEDVRDYFMKYRPAYRGWEPIDLTPEEDGETEETVEEAAEEAVEEGETADSPVGEIDETPGPADDAEVEDTGDDAEVFSDDDASEVEEDATPAEGEAVEPVEIPLDQVELTPHIRAEIREALIAINADKKMAEIGRAVAGLFAQDARPLPDAGRYKDVPADFVPTTLQAIAEKVKRDYGIDLEIINDDGEWVSINDPQAARELTHESLGRLPKTVVRIVQESQYGQPASLVEIPLPGVGLHGHMGLLSSVTVPGENQRRLGLGQALSMTRELLSESELQQPLSLRLQVGLGGAVQTADDCGSRYVFRVTDVDKAHPAPALADVRDEVLADARLLMAYEAMLERKDDHLEVARGAGVEALQPVATYVTGLTQFSRQVPPLIEGVDNAAPLVEAVFELADSLRASGAVIGDNAGDRVIVVELPRERKLLVFQLTEYYPLTRSEFVSNINAPLNVLNVSYRMIGSPAAHPLTLESLQQATGFKWKDGEAPSDEGASDGDDS